MNSQGAAAVDFSVETGLLITHVSGFDENFVWKHHLGNAALVTFSNIGPSECGREKVSNNSVVWGTGDKHERTYKTNTANTLANLLFTPNAECMYELGTNWGKAINAVHSTQATGGTVRNAPRTMQRAADWLHGSWRPARLILGDNGLHRLREWSHQVGASENNVMVHGSPGMAHWIPADDAKKGLLLTGEDTGFADPLYDFGWVLGEIAEFQAFYPSLVPRLHQIQKGLLDEYRGSQNPGLLNLARAYRLVHHAFDWHHYAGASDKQAEQLITLAAEYLSAPTK